MTPHARLIEWGGWFHDAPLTGFPPKSLTYRMLREAAWASAGEHSDGGMFGMMVAHGGRIAHAMRCLETHAIIRGMPAEYRHWVYARYRVLLKSERTRPLHVVQTKLGISRAASEAIQQAVFAIFEGVDFKRNSDLKHAA